MGSTQPGCLSRSACRGATAAAALAALLVALPLAASAQQRGGTLKVVLFPEPPALVSLATPSVYAGVVSTKIHEGLVTYDFAMNPKPALAESWATSADGKTVTFKLRRGVTWHDGQPFTAADVKFSLEQVWKVLHPRGRNTYANVTAVETPDDYTVVIRMSAPAPALMASLSSAESQVLPKHVYEGTEFTKNPKFTAPIGTGPFMFKEYKRGEYISLVRNPNYWDKGKPYLDGITILIVPDAGNRAALFETGEADLGYFNPVALVDVDRLKALPDLAVETKGYSYFAPVFLMEVNLRDPYLKDVRVRRAIMHALDRKFIVDNIWFGYGKEATGPISSSVARYYTGDVPKYPFDVAKANKILDDAGYARGANGTRFKIVHTNTVFSESARTADYFKQALARIGIEVELKSYDVGGFIREVYTSYNFGLTNNFMFCLPDPSLGVQRSYSTANIKAGVPFGNASGFSNPQVDKDLETAQTENDPAKRAALYADFQRIVQTELPALVLFEMEYVTLYNKRVFNHTLGAEAPYASGADIYLRK
jgi:peptide/nickel transport system substrate-binding protein